MASLRSLTGIEITQGSRALNHQDRLIAVIGLGYVGLPLAVEFGKKRPVIGFDIDPTRIAELLVGVDRTKEVCSSDLTNASQLQFTSKLEDLREASIYIITVPTPIDEHKRPNLKPLLKASETVGRVLKKNDIVIYESTVYPGATEQDCVPVLERTSGLRYNKEFFCGYSPERINPGDRARRLTTIVKVTSGSTPNAAEAVDSLYAEIIDAGTHRAESIQVAEAAKVIENTQRDLNIALVNELAIIFNRMKIDTQAVLRAAGTKWNFLPFQPGLVGGHCIGVDPYYLTYKAQSIGFNPEVILAGRRLNDSMGAYVASQLVKAMLKAGTPIGGSRILLLGLSFKENCPDLRNSRVVDVFNELVEFGAVVDVYDPVVDSTEVEAMYGIRPVIEPSAGAYDAIVLAVAHDVFRDYGVMGLRQWGGGDHILYDIKNMFPSGDTDLRL